MRRLFKLIFVVIISATSFIFMVNAFSMPSEHKGYLLGKISENLQAEKNENESNAFNKRLKRLTNEQELYKAVTEAKAGTVDINTVHILMHKLPELSNRLFKYANDIEIANVDTYNFYISIAEDKHNFDQAREGFVLALLNEVANADTFNRYITVAIKTGHFNVAKGAFLKATQTGLANADTYNIYISFVGQTEDFDVVKEVFLKAIQSGLADANTYNVYITIAGQTGHFDVAKEAFIKATATGLSDINTCNCYITAAGSADKFDQVLIVFSRMISSGDFTVETCKRFIRSAEITGHPRAAGIVRKALIKGFIDCEQLFDDLMGCTSLRE